METEIGDTDTSSCEYDSRDDNSDDILGTDIELLTIKRMQSFVNSHMANFYSIYFSPIPPIPEVLIPEFPMSNFDDSDDMPDLINDNLLRSYPRKDT